MALSKKRENMKVVFGTVHGEDVNGWFFHSTVALTSWVRRHSADPSLPEYINLDDYTFCRSGPAMAMGRGHLIGTFLEKTDGDALIMVDSDMAFIPQTIVEMVHLFEKMREDDPTVGILGGLAFISNDPRVIMPRPTLWMDDPIQPGMIKAVNGYNPNTLYEVAATGGACVIIHREVLEKVVKDGNPFHHVNLVNYPMVARSVAQMTDPDEIAPYLQSHVDNADQLGEDISFCRRVKKAGYRIFVHTGLKFDHAKSTLIGEPEFIEAINRQIAQEAIHKNNPQEGTK